jgi:hypothetical protein
MAFKPDLLATARPFEYRPTLDDLIETRLRATQLRVQANEARFRALLVLADLERVTAGGFCPRFAPPPARPQNDRNERSDRASGPGPGDAGGQGKPSP